MTEYLAGHPELARQLLSALQEVRARGYELVSMKGVRQPFDYEPRATLSRLASSLVS